MPRMEYDWERHWIAGNQELSLVVRFPQLSTEMKQWALSPDNEPLRSLILQRRETYDKETRLAIFMILGDWDHHDL